MKDNSASESGEVPHWKRNIDITVAILTLPLWLPLSALVAVLIRAVSDGPILFRQERIGLRGKRFTCLKFRTMHAANHSAAHQEHWRTLMNSNLPMVKMDTVGDPRIIPGGRWLRSLGLDELPQIINVLRGEMSLVGPRPCLPYEYAEYLPWQKERLDALPGLTGLWQVSGKNKTTFDEMVRLDIRYARTQTPAQDLAIISKTVPVLVGQLLEHRRRCPSLLRRAQAASMIFPSSARRPYSEQGQK